MCFVIFIQTEWCELSDSLYISSTRVLKFVKRFLFYIIFHTGFWGTCTCKMRNEMNRNDINRKEIHRSETIQNDIKLTYFNESISWGKTRQKLNEKNSESII